MHGQQAHRGELARADEIMDVTPGVTCARGARAAVRDRLAAVGVHRLDEVEPPAGIRVRDQCRAVAREARLIQEPETGRMNKSTQSPKEAGAQNFSEEIAPATI